jgi:hypothetical protein
MTFTSTHTRAFTGTDITVTVLAGGHESISSVSVTFDADALDDSQLPPGTENYSRTFLHAGDSTPGADHTLVVTAMDQDGAPHGATTRWSD